MAKVPVQIKAPVLVIKHNKHQYQELWILADSKEYAILPGVSGSETKRVGPALIEVTQKGVQRQIQKHPLNSKAIWMQIGQYVEAGIWALNNKASAYLLPQNLVDSSLRFSGTDKAQRKRMADNMVCK